MPLTLLQFPLMMKALAIKEHSLFWRFPQHSNRNALPAAAASDRAHKLMENLESGELLLYDLTDDLI